MIHHELAAYMQHLPRDTHIVASTSKAALLNVMGRWLAIVSYTAHNSVIDTLALHIPERHIVTGTETFGRLSIVHIAGAPLMLTAIPNPALLPVALQAC